MPELPWGFYEGEMYEELVEGEAGEEYLGIPSRSTAISRAELALFGSSTCNDLDKLFTDVRVLDSGTTSISFQFQAKVDGEPVFVKVSFGEIGTNLTESLIYSQVVPLLSFFSPHFVRLLGMLSCDDLHQAVGQSKTLSKTAKKRILDRLMAYQFAGHLRTPLRPSTFIVLEAAYPRAVTILNLLDNRKFAWADLKVILFQIAHTLLLMQKLKVLHNDLHLNNLFVYKLPRAVYMYYELEDGRLYRFKTRFLVAFFDWDRAVVGRNNGYTMAVPNPDLDERSSHRARDSYCDLFGVCNQFTPLLDWFKLNADLYRNYGYPRSDCMQAYRKWVGAFISKKLLNFQTSRSSARAYLCMADKTNQVSTIQKFIKPGARQCPGVEQFIDDKSPVRGKRPYIRTLEYVLTSKEYQYYQYKGKVPKNAKVYARIPE